MGPPALVDPAGLVSPAALLDRAPLLDPAALLDRARLLDPEDRSHQVDPARQSLATRLRSR